MATRGRPGAKQVADHSVSDGGEQRRIPQKPPGPERCDVCSAVSAAGAAADLIDVAPLEEDLTKEPQQIVVTIMSNDPAKVCLKVDPALHYRNVELEPYRFLGRGGYGSVFYSRRANVAVKALTHGASFRWELAVSLIVSSAARRQELSDIAKHFLQIYAFSSVEKIIVMEYIRHDLRTYLDEHCKPVTQSALDALVREFRGLAKALAFFHIECGLAHLDVKQNNILVNCDPRTGDPVRMVLADFSLAAINGNSFLNKCCMVCPGRPGVTGVHIIDTEDAVNSLPSNNILLFRMSRRPPEFLLDYCNGVGPRCGEVMGAMTTFAMDVFALGSVVHEVLLLCLSRVLGRDPFPHMTCTDEPMDHKTILSLLAYRLALTDYLSQSWSSAGFVNPAGTREGISSALQWECMRDMFLASAEAWTRTVRRKMNGARSPSMFADILDLSILLCHFDPDVRRTVSALA
ncbi:serine threonine protein kinase [Psittacid alphaherpesvirus 1]|uniref:Serine/threonine-protein kinase UL13 n=1 Tax=Psittacid herpesvirus 1 (isolate Amazon parrot/-/97-0001/1997) TaxID=670426 RepID=UL13_PSHV1|nr:tegument serine/threonine protein kinase [Psittacid alphaherpesvirus 1]Q6UDH7.1 RecName: Full=Serine/threonine-protein kinase UL13 [Psittacid herpesvirus 1 Amazon parrot/1997]AAQ73733.1 serine threonine protein kinase [Psittacid alphaherpesvirus 1]